MHIIRPHINPESNELCCCASCLFSHYIAFLFSSQRRSSPHVMNAIPSQGSSSLCPLPPISCPPITGGKCPFYSSFGFCTYSVGCYLPHSSWVESHMKYIPPPADAERGEVPPLPTLLPRGRSADEELHRLERKAARHLDEKEWSCDVCGFHGITEFHSLTVGEMYSYRYCPRCYSMAYLPEITYLLDHILWDVVDNYQAFKDKVDHYRALVPDEFKVPLSSEAHKMATTIFAWSLVTPKDIKDAVNAAYKALPSLSSIVSVGSGVGYVEHLFNRAVNDANLPAFGPVAAWRAAVTGEERGSIPSSLPRETVSFYGKRKVPIYAFDELVRRYEYSVHISIGGPLAVLSVDCANSALLLCWPPFGSAAEEQSSMGYEALEYFRERGGRVLIYIGDVSSTGDWRFHNLRDRYYKLVREYPVRREVRRWLPQEMGLIYAGNDTIGVYVLRDTL